MIERKFIEGRVRDYRIKQFLKSIMGNAGFSKSEIEKTPLGMKIRIYTSKPGLVVGKSGDNIRVITESLEKEFGLKNTQLEIEEIMEPDLDPKIVAERIVFQIKRFGKSRFKAIGYKALQNMIKAGAVGAEVVISGRIPGQRHNTWRFSGGRLPKSGYVSDNLVDRGFEEVQWNQGTIGVKVALLRSGIKNPDHFELVKEEKKVDIKKE